MSDITQAVQQDEIANSILDAPIVGSWKDATLSEQPVEQPQPQSVEPGGDLLADLETDRQDSRELSREESSERTHETQPDAQPQQEQIADPSPSQVRETVENLDAFNEQHQLADDLRTREFSLALAELGQPLNSINQGELGKALDRLSLSALQMAEGQPGQFPSIPPSMAAELCFTVLPAIGVDPRDPSVDREYVANTLHGAAINIHRTAQEQGTDDVRRLNDPQMAQFAFFHLAKGFGMQLEWPLSDAARGIALKLADGFAKYVLSYRQKVAQNFHPEQETQPRNRSGRKQGGTPRIQRFRTNNDIFDNETLERAELERVPRADARDFSPKAKRSTSRFETNSDIFSDDVMQEYALRRL